MFWTFFLATELLEFRGYLQTIQIAPVRPRDQNQIGIKTCYIPKVSVLRRKRISMLTGLKVEGLQMEKWNIKVQSSKNKWKNGVICRVIMFNPIAVVIKMSKMGHFLYFLLMTAKKVIALAKYLGRPKRFWVISENGMVNRLWSYRSWDIEGKNMKRTAEPAKMVDIVLIVA